MKISEPVCGFCPAKNEDTVIDVLYDQVRDHEYLQVGADCELASYGKCSIMLQCPIRKSAPKTLNK